MPVKRLNYLIMIEILITYCDLFEEDDNQTYRTLIKTINTKGIIKECNIHVHYDSFKSSNH